jgi:hypothetical protein
LALCFSYFTRPLRKLRKLRKLSKDIKALQAVGFDKNKVQLAQWMPNSPMR